MIIDKVQYEKGKDVVANLLEETDEYLKSMKIYKKYTKKDLNLFTLGFVNCLFMRKTIPESMYITLLIHLIGKKSAEELYKESIEIS